MQKINNNTQKYQNPITELDNPIDPSLFDNIMNILSKYGSNRTKNKLILLSNILNNIEQNLHQILFEALQSYYDKNKFLIKNNEVSINIETIKNLFISVLDRKYKKFY